MHVCGSYHCGCDEAEICQIGQAGLMPLCIPGQAIFFVSLGVCDHILLVETTVAHSVYSQR